MVDFATSLINDWNVVWKALSIVLVLYLLIPAPLILISIMKKKTIEWARIVSMSVLYMGLFIVIALPPIALSFFMAAVIFLGGREVYNAAKCKDAENVDSVITIYSLLTSSLIPLILFFFPKIFPIYLIIVAIVLFCIPVVTQKTRRALDKLARALAILLFGTMISFVILIRKMPDGFALTVFLIYLTNLADTTAFVFGKLVGKTKLLPLVSPGKTIEGSVLSLVAVFLIALLFRFFLLPDYSIRAILLLAIIIGVGSQLGDLILSMFKRDVGIKDYSQIIPGHGGILDRFDSLIITPPLFYYFLRYL